MSKPSNVVQANINALIQREKLGRTKYGADLDRKDLTHLDLLQHGLEEALDLANYLRAAITQLEARQACYNDLRQRVTELVEDGFSDTEKLRVDALEDECLSQVRDLLFSHDAEMVAKGIFG